MLEEKIYISGDLVGKTSRISLLNVLPTCSGSADHTIQKEVYFLFLLINMTELIILTGLKDIFIFVQDI